MVTIVSSAPDRFSTRSARNRNSSRLVILGQVFGFALLTILSPLDHSNATESSVRSRVRHPTGLARLPLAARDKTVTSAVASIGHAITTVPEFRRDAVVNHVPQHLGALSIFNEPEGIAAELEVVAPLVDAVGPMALDVDAPFHVGEQIVERVGSRLQTDVGNAHDRDAAPAVRSIRSLRSSLADFGSHFAIGAVVDEEPLADNIPLLAGNSIVVVARGCEGFRFRIVGDQVYTRRAIAEDAALFRSKEAGSGIVRFIAERPIQLAGMAAGLVHGQRKVLRVE